MLALNTHLPPDCRVSGIFEDRSISGSRTRTKYAYDGANFIAEYDAAGALLAKYAQGAGIDEPLAISRSGQVGYYDADGLGSVTSVIDSTLTPLATYAYDAFGRKVTTGGSLINPFQYTGREWDQETGLYYYRARYYNPHIGRFLNEDPAGFNGGMNFYTYTSNNPMNWIDPTGLRPGDKYKTLRCAGWNAVNDINPTSKAPTFEWPSGREYGGWIYQNPDGTYSYVVPVGGAAGTVNAHNYNPIPAGTTRAGDYHTHGGYDPLASFMAQGSSVGQNGYDWHRDPNEIFSPQDKKTNDGWGVPGFLGTPNDRTQMYEPVRGKPLEGVITSVTAEDCNCK